MYKNTKTDKSRFTTTSLTNTWMVDFITATRPILFSLLLDLLNRDEAEEVAQEAYLKVFVAMKADNAEQPTAFLLKVAKNLAFSRLRHKKVEVSHAQNSFNNQDIQAAVQIKPEEIFEQAAQNEILINAINQLPPACRKVFIYRKLQDKSHTEIANIMQISTKTVENHLSKGMMLCRKIMLECKPPAIRAIKGVS